jgi:hypothetical protein
MRTADVYPAGAAPPPGPGYVPDDGNHSPATWKILLPGPGGTEDLYGTQRIPTPDAGRLQAWLTPIIGSDQAAELAGAVDAAPPPTAAWRQHDSHGE